MIHSVSGPAVKPNEPLTVVKEDAPDIKEAETETVDKETNVAEADRSAQVPVFHTAGD